MKGKIILHAQMTLGVFRGKIYVDSKEILVYDILIIYVYCGCAQDQDVS